LLHSLLLSNGAIAIAYGTPKTKPGFIKVFEVNQALLGCEH
jgi:hypothetical protein